MDKSHLSLSAEYSVASELCRRGLYAQLTLGHQKRTDILVLSDDHKLTKIEVKSKQKSVWPACKGIYGKNTFIVFVDFFKKEVSSRPDFYVLTEADWIRLVKKKIKSLSESRDYSDFYMDNENCLVWLKQKTKQGKPYKGMQVKVSDIEKHRERWDKILNKLSSH